MTDVRATVLGIVERDDEYLVQRLFDPSGDPFYRPIGGGIEYGEESGRALEREFREELDVAVSAGATLGTVENRFTWGGDPKHEFVVVRRAEFEDLDLYDRDRFEGVDDGGRIEYEAGWYALPELVRAPEPLYPDGLTGLLRGEVGTGRGHLADPDD